MSQRRLASVDEYPTVPDAATRLSGNALGIDIGGTGIKAAIVDLATGRLVTDRVRELTPHPATPKSVMDVVARLIRSLEATGNLTPDMPGGAGFPSVIRAGRAMTATHGDPSWIGADIRRMLGEGLNRPMTVLNDGDAAGVAEIAYGAGKKQHGVVLLLDLGTGIGTALFTNGQLVPNMQLGHVELNGRDAEARLSPLARRRRKIGWKQWAGEFNELLARYEAYVWPDLMIIGGGAAKDFAKFGPFLKSNAPIVAATIGTNAGIVGAARVGGHTAGNVAGTAQGRPSHRR